MSVPTARSRNRWLAIQAVRFACVAIAILGVVLLGRAEDLPRQLLGMAIALMAMWMMVVAPKMLAHRWRTPPPDDAA